MLSAEKHAPHAPMKIGMGERDGERARVRIRNAHEGFDTPITPASQAYEDRREPIKWNGILKIFDSNTLTMLERIETSDDRERRSAKSASL